MKFVTYEVYHEWVREGEVNEGCLGDYETKREAIKVAKERAKEAKQNGISKHYWVTRTVHIVNEETVWEEDLRGCKTAPLVV